MGARAVGTAGVHEVQAVVGDELGARLGGVVEQPREGTIVLDRARAEVVGGVQDQPQRARLERGAQRARVAPAASAIGQHGRRGRVHLQPAHPGLLVRRQHAGRRPGVAVQVQAQAVVHPRSWFASGVRALLRTGDRAVNRRLLRDAGCASRSGIEGRSAGGPGGAGVLGRAPERGWSVSAKHDFAKTGHPRSNQRRDALPLDDAVLRRAAPGAARGRRPTPAAATAAAPARSGRSTSSSARRA